MRISGIFSKIKTAIKNGGLGAVLALVTVPAVAANAAAVPGLNVSGLCELITQMQGVFKTLRILAFVGAGFIVAKYAWEAITTGTIGGQKTVVEGLKAVGVPMIVGFVLLFSIGILLGFLSNGENFGCPALTTGW